jgi:ankyrin repeat protein
MEVIKALVENGAEVNGCNEVINIGTLQRAYYWYLINGETFFHGKTDQELEFLATLGVDFNAPTTLVPIIHVAVKSGKPEIVNYLVEHGANPSDCAVSATALFGEVYKKDKQLIKLLVKYGASVNALSNWTSPLAAAIEEGNTEMVTTLVKLGVPVAIDHQNQTPFVKHQTALKIAVMLNDLELVRTLLALGADVNLKNDVCVSALHRAVARGDPDLLQALCCLKPNVNSLRVEGEAVPMKAMRTPGMDLEIIKVLVDAGADLNWGFSEDITPLHDAAKLSNTDVVETLKELGADMNCGKKEGIKPVHVAVLQKRRDILEYLGTICANMNVKFAEDVTPLHEAVRVGNADMVKCLVRCGADLSARKKDNLTRMFAVVRGSDVELLQSLIKLGGDANMFIDKRVSALHDAVKCGNTQMIEVLVQLGLRPLTTKDKYSPLGVCINTDYMDSAHLLLTNGVNQDIDPIVQVTALEEAIQGKHEESVTKLHSLMNREEWWCRSRRLEIESCPNTFELACSHGYFDMVRLLLICGSDLNRFPIPFGKLDSLPLAHTINYSTIKEAIIAEKVIETIRLDRDFQSLLRLPNTRMESIHSTLGIGDVQYIPVPRSTEVAEDVYNLLQVAAIHLKLFSKGKWCRIGSMAEGTKVILPNEMDFLIQLEMDAAEEINIKYIGFGGYVRYSSQSSQILKEGSHMFHTYFVNDITNANGYVKQLENGRVIFTSHCTHFLESDNRKACSVLSVSWNDGSTQFSVFVDVVPCLHIKNWLKEGTQKTWLMDLATLKNRGYLIVPKPPHVKSEIANRCTESDLDELWRYSFAHLETEHMQRLEPRVKNVYITAKSLRNPDVCRILFREYKSYDKPAEKYVSSYMLKMEFLKNVESFLAMNLSIGAMVCKVYDDLVEDLTDGFVPLFFMPTANALDGLKLNVKKCTKVAKIMQKFVRKLYERDYEGKTDEHDKLGENKQRAVYQRFEID